MKNRNGRTRIEFTTQELEAIHNLVCDRLRGEVTSKLKDETLGGIVMKVGRASNRIKAHGVTA
ncbi:hypothetical protein ES705_07849 [subsurface metagenome]|jgi:hypothetical protein